MNQMFIFIVVSYSNQPPFQNWKETPFLSSTFRVQKSDSPDQAWIGESSRELIQGTITFLGKIRNQKEVSLECGCFQQYGYPKMDGL